MATMETISEALKLVEEKKDNLRKSFEDLQSHSSSLSSFNLTWSDLDYHFTSLQSSLEHKFSLLQSQEALQSQPSELQSQPSVSIAAGSTGPASVPARPELKSLCEKMDGLGLRKYMIERFGERNAIRVELQDALRCSPDAASMVLDAMEGFYGPNSSKKDKSKRIPSMRTSCVILLEELLGLKPEIGAEVKERAKNLAMEWKGKVRVDGENSFEASAFLNLVALYGLADNFNKEELVDFALVVARYRQTAKLCRLLGLGDKISDLITKLMSSGKPLMAIKFIFEFGLTDTFHPVSILKDHVNESKKQAKKIRKSGKKSLQSLNEAATRELSAMKATLKIVEDHNLESQYPTENLRKRIEILQKEQAVRKRPAAISASKPPKQSKPLKHNRIKRQRTTAPAGPAGIPKRVPAASSTIPQFEQPHLQPAGLLPDYPPSYLNSSTGPYVLAGSSSAVDPYASSSAALYGSAGAHMGVTGNQTPLQSHQSHMTCDYSAYGGYGLPPQYHQSYYPQ